MRPLAITTLLLPLLAPAGGGQCRVAASTPAGAAAGDGVGTAVALLGDLAVVGAPGDDGLGANAGAAWVLERAADGTWSALARLTASDGAAGDRFGGAVAIGAGTIAVGAEEHGDSWGAAYVFVEPAGGWVDATETARLTAAAPRFRDGFGCAVALSADGATLLVGAWGDDTVDTDAGAASVYDRPASGWASATTPATVLTLDAFYGPYTGLGWAVDLSADGATALVGAPYVWELHGWFQGPGRAVVFERPAAGWSAGDSASFLIPSDGSMSDRFGVSVDLAPDGASAIVGTERTYFMSPEQHPAYVFERPGATWPSTNETARLTLADQPSLPMHFSADVAISDVGALVGSPLEPEPDPEAVGRAYYWARPAGGWTSLRQPTDTLFAPEGADGDNFGTAVALAGTRALVGAPGPPNGSGGTGLVHALVLAECDGPGLPGCFGVGCPCGNDDPEAGCANATGAGGLLAGSGSASASVDDLVLVATRLPTDVTGLFYGGDGFVRNAFYDGWQCALGATTVRFLASAQSSGAAGTMSHTGFVAEAAGAIAPGTTWHFHCWYRDLAGPCGSGANLTNTYSVLFAP